MNTFFQALALLILLTAANAFAPSTPKGKLLVTASFRERCTRRHIVDNSITASPFTALSLSTSSDDSKISTDISGILNRALNADAEATIKLLETISGLRQSNAEEELVAYLSSILTIVDESKKPLWTKLRITSMVSKRSRRAALSRVLNISTPSAPSDADTDTAKKSRRRRALVIALKSLVDDENAKEGISISKIEKRIRMDLKDRTSSNDMESRMPPGLETPTYDVIVKRQKYEIRDYKSFSVCSVRMSKPRPDSAATDQKISQPQMAGASSFGALAGYLFGKNKEEVAMKMTTPVLTTGTGEDKEMAFVLPSTYWDEDSLSKAPLPLDNSLVQLKQIEESKRAVLMFGGLATSKDVKSKKEALKQFLRSDKDWVAAEDTLTVAQYNDPFTPPWKRRNEVSVLVQSRK